MWVGCGYGRFGEFFRNCTQKNADVYLSFSTWVSHVPGNSTALSAVSRQVQKDSGCVLYQVKTWDCSSVCVSSPRHGCWIQTSIKPTLFYSNIFKPTQFSSYRCCISPVKKWPADLGCFSVKHRNSQCILPSCCHCHKKLSWFIWGRLGIYRKRFLHCWSLHPTQSVQATEVW